MQKMEIRAFLEKSYTVSCQRAILSRHFLIYQKRQVSKHKDEFLILQNRFKCIEERTYKYFHIFSNNLIDPLLYGMT